MKAHNHEVDEVVIGATLSAFLYSYYTGSPLVYVQPNIPFRFDYFDPYFDLDKIVEQPEPKEFVTIRSKASGASKTKYVGKASFYAIVIW